MTAIKAVIDAHLFTAIIGGLIVFFARTSSNSISWDMSLYCSSKSR